MIKILVNVVELEEILILQKTAKINPNRIYSSLVESGEPCLTFYVEYSSESAQRLVVHSENLCLLIAKKLLKETEND